MIEDPVTPPNDWGLNAIAGHNSEATRVMGLLNEFYRVSRRVVMLTFRGLKSLTREAFMNMLVMRRSYGN